MPDVPIEGIDEAGEEGFDAHVPVPALVGVDLVLVERSDPAEEQLQRQLEGFCVIEFLRSIVVKRFEVLVNARHDLGDQKCWIRFFAKPCCPSCDEENVDRHIRDLAAQIRECDELDEAQKEELLGIADQRCAWYKTLPICRH